MGGSAGTAVAAARPRSRARAASTGPSSPCSPTAGIATSRPPGCARCRPPPSVSRRPASSKTRMPERESSDIHVCAMPRCCWYADSSHRLGRLKAASRDEPSRLPDPGRRHARPHLPRDRAPAGAERRAARGHRGDVVRGRRAARRLPRLRAPLSAVSRALRDLPRRSLSRVTLLAECRFCSNPC